MGKSLIPRRRVRIILLIVCIALALLEIQTRFCGKLLDEWAKRRGLFIAYYRTEEYKNTWFGVPVAQFPGDLVTYSNLVNEVRPDVIVEAGTAQGGLTAFLATVLHYVNPEGKVVTIDIFDEDWNKTVASGKIPDELEEKIIFIKGDDTSESVLSQIRALVHNQKTLIILDTLHSKEHVLKELHAYEDFVSKGSYLIVNDTHHDDMYTNPGPRAAVLEYLETTDRFVLETRLPRFYISCIISGVLKRVGD